MKLTKKLFLITVIWCHSSPAMNTDNQSKLWLANKYLHGYSKLSKNQRQEDAFNLLRSVMDSDNIKQNPEILKEAQNLLKHLLHHLSLKFQLAIMLKDGKIFLGDNTEKNSIELLTEISEQKISLLLKYSAKLNLAQIYYYGHCVLNYAKSKELYIDVLLNSNDKNLQIQAKKELINFYLFAADPKFQNDQRAKELLIELSKANDFPKEAAFAIELLKSLEDEKKVIPSEIIQEDYNPNAKNDFLLSWINLENSKQF